MRNSLLHPLHADDDDADWQTLSFAWRLRAVGALFLLCAVAILARLAWVQTRLSEDFLAALSATTVEEEVLPARDGRILSGSTVLATDIEQYEIQVHYRWLQTNADPNWLRQQIRQRLTKSERRDSTLVEETKRQILSDRVGLLSALHELAGVGLSELQARCTKIEERVARISESVNRRAMVSTIADDDFPAETSDESFLSRPFDWIATARDALTTPPRRDATERIVVREEESFHTLIDDVTFEIASAVNEHPERFPGVRINSSTRRTYLQPETAVHVVGARTPRTDADRSHSTGENSDDNTPPENLRKGRFGVEHSYDKLIAGRPGLQRITRDRRQLVISTDVVQQPVSGRDLTLTLELKLQRSAEQLLAEVLGDAERTRLPLVASDADVEQSGPPEPEFIPTGGCVVVMEAATGRLLVAASAPDFELTLFTAGTSAQWTAMNGDTRRPFVPRFTGMALPPGSTWKILTAMAALESGAITAHDQFACQGFLDTPDQHRCLLFRLHGTGHGSVTLRSALAQSCNVYFFDAARRMGMTPLVEWSERLEFGQPTGVDLPFERSGTLPRTSNVELTSSSEQRRSEREALGFSIGQSRLTVTPLQMARLLATVANGGLLVTPHVRSDEGFAQRESDSASLQLESAPVRIPGLSRETLQSIHEGLVAAIEQPGGTGFKTIRIADVHIAGKTGTAENAPGKPDHAWFAGYVPAEAPRYVVIVALEHGGSGSRAAGPVARELIRDMANAGMLESL